ncbi:hypothetical protein B0H14DRAFT_3428272 [Mycena olivaceomarginata]|nr:hypothetical protein B0H14DRAFT_3428272 [Mycena olivaceomarginata]
MFVGLKRVLSEANTKLTTGLVTQEKALAPRTSSFCDPAKVSRPGRRHSCRARPVLRSREGLATREKALTPRTSSFCDPTKVLRPGRRHSHRAHPILRFRETLSFILSRFVYSFASAPGLLTPESGEGDRPAVPWPLLAGLVLLLYDYLLTLPTEIHIVWPRPKPWFILVRYLDLSTNFTMVVLTFGTFGSQFLFNPILTAAPQHAHVSPSIS